MRFSLIETDSGLEYHEYGTTVWARALFAGVGLAAITASLFFVKTALPLSELHGPSAIGGAIATLSAIAAFCLFGGFCLKIALTLPMQSLIFHAGARQVTYTIRSPACGIKTARYDFGSISNLRVMPH